MEIYRHKDGGISHERLNITGEEPLRAELAAFLDSIRHKRPPPVSGQEARDALALALEVTRLAHENHP